MAMGVTVMSGWMLRVPVMVEFRAGMVAMVFNTALCFTMTGLALALPGLLRRPLPQVQAAFGTVLTLIGAMLLFEHISDRALGIDWASLHTWLNDGNTRPGRPAPNTAIGFMLLGVSLVLLGRITTRAREFGFRFVLFCLFGIGVTGLLGYMLSPDQLFGWARSARMAIPTALGMLLAAAALTASFRRAATSFSGAFSGLDEKITFVSAAVVCVVALTAGLTGFVFQEHVLKSSLRDKLQSRLDSQRNIIKTELQQLRTASAHASTDLHLLAPAYLAALAPDNLQAKADLTDELDSLIHGGVRRAVLVASDGHVVGQAGQPDTATAAVQLALPPIQGQQAFMAWEGELMLHTSATVSYKGVAFGQLFLSQRMEMTPTHLANLSGLGSTGEIAVCGGRPTTLVCLPSGGRPDPYVIGRINIAGQPLPMSHAVDGKAGLIASIDYKGHNVMAAFAPIENNLGLVVKQDTVELYSVIRRQLAVMVPVLLLLLIAGAALMRSQIKPLAARLIASERRARDRQIEMNAVVGSVGEGIMTINESLIIESFNKAAADIFAYRPEEVIGQPATMLLPPDGRQVLVDGLRDYLQTGHAKVIGKPKLEMNGLRKDGAVFTAELTINEIRLDQRRLFVGVVRDITERKQSEERLLFLAQYDILTGLPNRALFMDRLSGAVLRATRSRTAMAVMFLDLDSFKQINDTLGHHGGDLLLKQFGERLTQSVRKSDTVARLAGDEFTVILEGLSYPIIDTRDVADKIIAAMQRPFDLGGHQVSVTTSIGLAIHASNDTDIDALLRRADDAMYRAKHGGKNRWSI